jgi:hypothetical protein
MALVKYGLGIAELRGKQAGTVFSRNTYGGYMRQKVSPVQPRTSAQLLVRTQLATVAQAWRGLLQTQRDQWNLIAPTYSRTDVFGNRTPLTGFNLYGMLNRMRQVLGLALLTTPPVPTAVPGVAALALAVVSGGPTYTITFTPTPLPANMYGVIYCTPGLSPGIQFAGNNTRVVGVAAPAQTSPYEIHVDYSAIFGPLVQGLKYVVQVQIVHGPSGIASALNQASAIAT